MHSAEDHACNLRHQDTTCIEDLVAEVRDDVLDEVLLLFPAERYPDEHAAIDALRIGKQGTTPAP